MMVKPTVTELLKNADNRYELVIASARRARQIAEGDKVLTDVKEESPVTLAVNEIAEGKIKIDRNRKQREMELRRKLEIELGLNKKEEEENKE